MTYLAVAHLRNSVRMKLITGIEEQDETQISLTRKSCEKVISDGGRSTIDYTNSEAITTNTVEEWPEPPHQKERRVAR
jgi:hypothetical protein